MRIFLVTLGMVVLGIFVSWLRSFLIDAWENDNDGYWRE